MFLEIITPYKKVFEGEIESAIFPGAKGSFQVLNNHASLISTLIKGKVTYKHKKKTEIIQIDGGVVEVFRNHISLLTEKIEG